MAGGNPGRPTLIAHTRSRLTVGEAVKRFPGIGLIRLHRMASDDAKIWHYVGLVIRDLFGRITANTGGADDAG